MPVPVVLFTIWGFKVTAEVCWMALAAGALAAARSRSGARVPIPPFRRPPLDPHTAEDASHLAFHVAWEECDMAHYQREHQMARLSKPQT